MSRRPVVGVMGSGNDMHEDRAQEVGSWLAREGVHLLTGGGGGVMASVSKAFRETPGREGLVIGIIPGENGSGNPKAGYPNPEVEISIFTHLHQGGREGAEALSRNHINVLSSDVIIVLPGGSGTATEVSLAEKYGRKLVVYLKPPFEFPELPDGVLVESDFEKVKHFVRANLPKDLVNPG